MGTGSFEGAPGSRESNSGGCAISDYYASLRQGILFRPHHHKAERARILKKQVLGGVMCVLAQIVRYQPRLIIGTGQACLMAGVMRMPLVVELAIRLRAPIDREIKKYRRSWGRVTGVIAVEPQIGPDAARHQVCGGPNE